MNDKAHSPSWSEIREKITMKWGKLSTRDIESLRDNLDGLVQKIMKHYGCSIDRAERECHEFRVSVRNHFV